MADEKLLKAYSEYDTLVYWAFLSIVNLAVSRFSKLLLKFILPTPLEISILVTENFSGTIAGRP